MSPSPLPHRPPCGEAFPAILLPALRRRAAVGSWLLLAGGLLACSKNSEPANPAPAATATARLTASDWHVTAFTFSNSTGTHDIWAMAPACNKDDHLQFNADHTLLTRYGANRCSATQTDQTSSWTLSANDAKLTFSYGSSGPSPLDYEVLALSATEMRLQNTLTNASGTSTFHLTLTH